VLVDELNENNISNSVLSGWKTDNKDGQIEVNPDTIYGVGDNRGKVLELEARSGDEANIYKDLNVRAGDTVELTFDLTARKGHAGATSAVDVYFEGVLIETITPDVCLD
jgi:hypothetical protein